jgi:hypothetical protein
MSPRAHALLHGVLMQELCQQLQVTKNTEADIGEHVPIRLPKLESRLTHQHRRNIRKCRTVLPGRSW